MCIVLFFCGFPRETPEKAICHNWPVIWGSGGPFPPPGGGESGEHKSPRNPRGHYQNAYSPQELSIGAPHTRDTLGRSQETFHGHAPRGAFFTSQGYPQLAPLVRVDGSRKLPQMNCQNNTLKSHDRQRTGGGRGVFLLSLTP